MPGFNAFEQTGITLNVGDTRWVNISLKVGTMAETVSVRSDASLVEMRSLSVGQVTTQELIVGLPLNGRSATQLLVLEGGTVDQGTSGPGRLYPGAANISVAGGSANSTQYLVDGGYNNNPDGNQGNAIPFPDALQEFRTASGVRDARFGMSSGATVNAVTKSGTNNFHGNVFDFMRHHKFNSISFFDRTENGGLGLDDGLKRNQFGGTIGGPIIRDKLFFFFGTQITRNIQFPTSNQTVLTPEVLRGDFPVPLPAMYQHSADAGCAVREQSDRSGVVPSAVAPDREHGAAARSSLRSGWLRTLPVPERREQHRPAVRVAR